MSETRKRIREYFFAHWLPFALIVLFVLQNYLFDLWLKIDPGMNADSLIAGSAALAALLFAPALLFKKRTGYLYLGIVSLAVTIIFISQYLYYAYSGGFLQASSFFYAKQGTDEFATIKTLLDYNLLLFIIGPLFILAHWIFSRENNRKK